ncbi:MAG: hypothetical protein A2W76_09800 [Gammaproteobacteria bacterium RIFCSPLOWO2_12_47_11]|nr:MAG: hypothetical protein A2W76_09800 [Gammaproteobacteria bacterium RIFCSPLOWO2_12_47_11]
MNDEIANGTVRTIDGKPCVYYDGYWVRWYEIKADDFASKKKLIDQLTKRVFHHAEPGINTPGHRLEQIQGIYENETDPARKRVKGAMLAGALLNRGADILTAIVDLQEAGVKIEIGHPLLRECGKCLMEALEYGKNIKLSSGGEGLDELWGEPFKVFSMPMEKFYESRYIKVAQAKTEIDKIIETLTGIVSKYPELSDLNLKIIEFGESSKDACETIRTDPVIFDIWPRYVAAREALEEYITNYMREHESENGSIQKKIINLVNDGSKLLISMAIVRVPIPDSTIEFLKKCEKFKS